MSKHTPGPWFNDQSTKSIKVSRQSPAFNRGHFNICKYPTRTNKSLVSHEEWIANGHLLAAAPEMLAFIESLTDASGPYPFINATSVVADAYEILRKVRGKNV